MCAAFRKIVFLLLCGLAYCGISAVPAFARGGMHHGFPDSPHNTTSGTLCLSCHDFTSPDPKFIPVDPDEGSTIDETRYNSLCWSCHYSGGDGPYVKTHSSLNTSDRYGDWTVECLSQSAQAGISSLELQNC